MKKLASPGLIACQPPFWARGGHLQTLLGHLLPSPPAVRRADLRGTPVRLTLPDGDQLALAHLEGDGDTVVYLFHGLGSDHQASYIQRSAAVARGLGLPVYLFNHRGCGDGQGLARRPYHSGRAEDLAEAIRHGRARYPERKHLAIGFSLSANALLLLLSGKRGDVLPDLAIAANGPIQLERAARLLHQGWNRIYDLRFVSDGRRDIRQRRRAGLLDRDYRISPVATLYDFDALYTCPASGFASREEYYRTCSTRDLLAEIRVPTVLLTAKDDPFIDYRDYVAARLSPSVHLHVEEHGGHLGYLTSEPTPLGSGRWLDYALHHYIEALRGGQIGS